MSEFYNYWGGILNGTEINLYTVTQQLIDDLYEDNIITLESERIERYDKGEDEVQEPEREKKRIFQKAGVQQLPKGFSPKRKRRQVKVRVGNDDQIAGNHAEVSHDIAEQVLIAEIGGGPRWKQVNFPVSIFQDFFGAQRGNNEYVIELMNIAKDGTLGDVEKRQAVTVKSNNFRFEIKCAETCGKYPGNHNRPIGLFVKLDSSEFLYQVLMPDYPVYEKIKNYLMLEAKPKRADELRRVIVDVEAIHALYPELII